MLNQRNPNEKKRVLIVDDEEGIRFMLESKFTRNGYDVSVAANGLHAMQVVRAQSNFDLIVCDLKMPGQSGLEFFKSIRELGHNIPFLIITGYPQKPLLTDASKLGLKTILLKPVNQEKLMGCVEELIAA